MPIYEYRCESCQNSFEALVTRSDPQAECPQCGGHELTREMSVFASSVSSTNGGAQAASGPAPAPRACCGGGCGCR
jgi:putative FmdB family regulatory protein